MKTKLIIFLLFLLSFQIGRSQIVVDFMSNIFGACNPSTINFTDLTSGNPNSWKWNFGDGDTSLIQNPSHVYTSPGNYTVTLIASDGVNSDTLTKPNWAASFANPTANFNQTLNGLTATFLDLSFSNLVIWNWDLGNGSTSMLQNPTETYTFPPDSCYNVTLTVTNVNGCQDTITKIGLICITTVKELNTKNIKVYPTPAIGNQINISGELNGLENIVGYDILGKQVNIPIVSKNNNEIVLETSQLKKGNYILKLLFKNDAPITKKIIMQ